MSHGPEEKQGWREKERERKRKEKAGEMDQHLGRLLLMRGPGSGRHLVEDCEKLLEPEKRTELEVESNR